MFFGKKKVDLAELPLEQVRFSAEDLFTLMGGFDAGLVACNTKNLDGNAIMRRQAHKGPWRRDLVNRYQASGWVDAEGNPNEELGRAVRCLSSEGVVLMNGKYGEASAGVVYDGEWACGVVKAPGHNGGFFLRPFPEDRSQWERRFREVFPEKDYPFTRASVDLHAAIAPRDDEAKSLPIILGEHDTAAIHAYAERHGVPEELLVQLSGQMTRNYRMFLVDNRGCTFDTSQGFRNPLEPRGQSYRLMHMWMFPGMGCVLSGCYSPRPGYPDDWACHLIDYKKTSLFYAIDTSACGSLYDVCTRVSDYPVQDVVDFEPRPTLFD